jgi:hypothetical protein
VKVECLAAETVFELVANLVGEKGR